MGVTFFSKAGSNSWACKRSRMCAFLVEYTCKGHVGLRISFTLVKDSEF